MSSSPRADAAGGRFRSPRSVVAAGPPAGFPGRPARAGVCGDRGGHRVCAATLSDESARRAGGRDGPPLGRALRIRAAPPPPGMGPMMPGFPDPPGYPRRVIIRDDYGPGPRSSTLPGRPPAPSARWCPAARRSTPVSSPPTAPGPKSAPPQRNNSPPSRRTDRPTTVDLDGLGPLPRHRDARPGPGRDDRHGVADLGCRRHTAVGARHLLRGRRDRADRRHDGGHRDHPPPTRPAVKGFRGGTAGGRPRTRPRRGAAAHADRQGRSGRRRTPRSASSAPR